jgi:hypothetical protein
MGAMMAALTIFYLLLADFSHYPPELVSLIDVDAYFNAHGVPVSMQTMEELAGTEPKNAADQVAQLLAIRWLGEQDAQPARIMLQKIANGELAQGELGFAKEHARRALARLNKQPIELQGGGGRNLKEALTWFPRDVTFCAALDLRAAWSSKPFAPTILANVPGLWPFPWGFLNDKGQLYTFADQVGNFRLERMAVAFAPSRAGKDGHCIFVRFTGLVDRKRLLEVLAGEMVQRTVREEKGHAEPITSIVAPDRPALIMVGSTDLLIVMDQNREAVLPEIVQEVLAIKARKKPSVVEGMLAGLLRKVPDNAHALAVGDVPQELFEDQTKRGADCGLDPCFALLRDDIVLHAVVKKQIDVHFQGKTRNAADAQALLAGIARLQKEHTGELRQFLPDPSAQVLIDDLASIQVTAAGAEVTGQVVLSRDTAGALGDVLDKAIGAALNAAVANGFAFLGAVVRAILTVVAVLLLAAIGGIVAVLLMRARAA